VLQKTTTRSTESRPARGGAPVVLLARTGNERFEVLATWSGSNCLRESWIRNTKGRHLTAAPRLPTCPFVGIRAVRHLANIRVSRTVAIEFAPAILCDHGIVRRHKSFGLMKIMLIRIVVDFTDQQCWEPVPCGWRTEAGRKCYVVPH